MTSKNIEVMIKDITIFNYEDNTVRTFMINDAVFFVAKDVCDALLISNPNNVYQRLHTDDIRTMDVVDSIGRKQKMNVVNESGLYDLIFESRKTEAKEFRRWVTTEVLPSIRKTGKYELSKSPLTSMQIIKEQIEFLIQHEKQIQEHQHILEDHETRIATIEAKIKTTNKDYYSLAGYYALRKKAWNLSNKEAQKQGRLLSKESQNLDLAVIKVQDSKYGEVNGYHKDILKKVLGF